MIKSCIKGNCAKSACASFSAGEKLMGNRHFTMTSLPAERAVILFHLFWYSTIAPRYYDFEGAAIKKDVFAKKELTRKHYISILRCKTTYRVYAPFNPPSLEPVPVL